MIFYVTHSVFNEGWGDLGQDHWATSRLASVHQDLGSDGDILPLFSMRLGQRSNWRFLPPFLPVETRKTADRGSRCLPVETWKGVDKIFLPLYGNWNRCGSPSLPEMRTGIDGDNLSMGTRTKVRLSFSTECKPTRIHLLKAQFLEAQTVPASLFGSNIGKAFFEFWEGLHQGFFKLLRRMLIYAVHSAIKKGMEPWKNINHNLITKKSVFFIFLTSIVIVEN